MRQFPAQAPAVAAQPAEIWRSAPRVGSLPLVVQGFQRVGLGAFGAAWHWAIVISPWIPKRGAFIDLQAD